ncbi:MULTISPECIES: hypothetical protein [unclassified Paenibacillus]|uniref:hypothetical protein n=1 Tax=unclassified Paenibacillus TaxID=185978 RepID=UPI0024058C61|nr:MULTISPECIES: hypothetical protein [unclassified Paenibacillus]MDF9841761.1 hypothetical protein [Paenibacillus sp. PastF-2]MDF9848558.1 hypothetical protein [Paenibacillus sp. PastM-2]MDF9854920.1 hypothetical protein [Paenibacillus sp. PastF-1]MDH6480190.1 hypothetical protein [Paenibacillus sp. PastH-2]MDH6507826.1 hypothetical protein [Paenibacillus sp. PastM-3]
MNPIVVNLLTELNQSIKNRNAYASIDGYFYQFELTLLHILLDQSSEDPFGDQFQGVTSHYKIEQIEDYTKVFENSGVNYIRLAQVKHHNKYAGNAEYLEALLWLYYSFLRFENKDPNLKTKYYIFHHDKSPLKNTEIVLKEAFEKNEKETDPEKQHSVYHRILELNTDSPQMRTKFIGQAKFVKTQSLLDVTTEIKSRLFSAYGSAQYNPDFLYAAALSKIINDGRAGNPTGLQQLSNFFSVNPIIDPKFYLLKILQLIDRSLDEYIDQMSEPNPLFPDTFVDPIVINDYKQIAKKIHDFFEKHFDDPRKRTSFLLSISDFRNLAQTTTLNAEYEEFCKHFIHIRAFVFKLAKILYAYEKNAGSIANLDDWFDFTENCWLFKHPHEQRKQGVILADPQQSLDAIKTIGMLRTRLSTVEDEDHIPNVWYWGNIAQLRASYMIPYKLNITKVPVQQWALSTCEPDFYFTVQCLNCLNLGDASSVDHVANIFKANCMMG